MRLGRWGVRVDLASPASLQFRRNRYDMSSFIVLGITRHSSSAQAVYCSGNSNSKSHPAQDVVRAGRVAD